VEITFTTIAGRTAPLAGGIPGRVRGAGHPLRCVAESVDVQVALRCPWTAQSRRRARSRLRPVGCRSGNSRRLRGNSLIFLLMGCWRRTRLHEVCCPIGIGHLLVTAGRALSPILSAACSWRSALKVENQPPQRGSRGACAAPWPCSSRWGDCPPHSPYATPYVTPWPSPSCGLFS